MAQTLTTDLEQIDGQDLPIDYAGSADIRAQLPEIVDSSAGGTQIDDGTLLSFTNNGAGIVELQEFGTGQVVMRVKPFEKVSLVPVLDAGDGAAGWLEKTLYETIVDNTPDSHIANLTTTAVTSEASAAGLDESDTYTDAAVNTGFNSAADTAIATTSSFEPDFDASVAEIEAKVNAIIDALEDQNLSAAA